MFAAAYTFLKEKLQKYFRLPSWAPLKYGLDVICPILRPPQLFTGISYEFESVIFGI